MIVSAQYANADGTAVEAITEDRGAVLYTQDRPDGWAALMASGVAIAAYAPPAIERTASVNGLITALSDAEWIVALGAKPRLIARFQARERVPIGNAQVAALAVRMNISAEDWFTRAGA